MATKDRPLRLLAVDPGEVHVGVAFFIGPETSWVCEYTPDQFMECLETWINTDCFDRFVGESFRLYADKSKAQHFKEMGTSELIGAIKWVLKRAGIEQDWQPASIQKPTEAILRARKIPLVSRGHGPHCKSAELHGRYWLAHH